jgi:hypothetical protein
VSDDLLPIDDLPPGVRRHVALLQQSAQETPEVELSAHDLLDPADGGGHRRPHYAGLFLLGEFNANRPLPPEPVDAAANRSADEAWPDQPFGGLNDQSALRLAFDHLALFAAGRCAEQAAATFGRIAHQKARLTDDGSNPEPRWYGELVLLHALCTYAGLAGDAELLRAAADIAAYHQAETQPDHATGQPLAVHAALLSPDTLPLAELLLLPLITRGRAVGVDQLLLLDAAATLRRPAVAAFMRTRWPS